VADGSPRSAQEREAARREREAARAAREAPQRSAGDGDGGGGGGGGDLGRGGDGGRGGDLVSSGGSGSGGGDDGAGAIDEPLEQRRDAAGAPADAVPGGEPLPPRAAAENGDRDGARRVDPAIKSFPSPPDPDFYLPENELEMPSGTKRVSRLGNRQRPTRPRPARRRRQVKPRQRTAPQTRRRSWLVRVIALLAIVLAAALAWFLIALFQPFGVSPHGRVKVVIPRNSSSSDVAKLLHADHVISSSFFFELRATLAGDRSDLRSGTYHLQEGMSYGSVLKKLTTAPPPVPTTKLTIEDGHSRSQVAALLKQQGIKGNYVALTRHSKLLDPAHYGAPKSTPDLEGFLFPDTFQLRKPVKLATLVNAQLTDFKRRFGQLKLTPAEHAEHLTAYQLLIVASLIEGEAATQSDRDKVASVIYNRLRDHMPLQLDATTRYATGNYTKPLTDVQLNSSSPYNTRNHAGLPPTPINSPGLSALQAAAHPANTDDLYFFAKHCTDQTVFFINYTQFQNAVNADAATACRK
jgi:UPF0755 protein